MAGRGIEDRVLEETLARARDDAFAVGADGTIVMWNRAAETIMGYRARDAMGGPSCDIFVGERDGGRCLCYQGCHGVAPGRASEILHVFDVDTRTKAGKPIWLYVNALAIPSRNGRGGLTVHLLREVTTLKDLLRRIEQRLPAPAPRRGDPSTLTRREREILRVRLRILPQIPVGRRGLPEEVAGLIIHLCSAHGGL